MLVGDGPCLPELQEHSRTLGIAGDCVFIPPVVNVPEWLHAIDVFVLPSVSEALSNSLMEAMASGCCAVASRVGGSPELVHAGETGLLFESDDAIGLSLQLKRLIADPELRRKMAAQGQRLIQERFSTQILAHRIQQIYRKSLLATKLKANASSPGIAL